MTRRAPVLVASLLFLVACGSTPRDTGHARSMSYLGDPDVVGTLEGPEVDSALAEAGKELEACLGTAPDVQELVVWLEIEEDGTVAGISPGVGQELPVPVAFCLHEVVAALEFPEPEGGMASVAVSLRR